MFFIRTSLKFRHSVKGLSEMFQVIKPLPNDSRILMTPWRMPFKSMVGKGENAGDQHFLLFPKCFLLFDRQISSFELDLICRLQLVSTLTSLTSLTLSLISPGFLHVCGTSLLKTLWKNKKLLITSNFSFSHSVFYPFGELSPIFIRYEIVVCKLFKVGRV